MKSYLAIALLALSGHVVAQSVQVQDPWVRATVSATGTGAFMKLKAASDVKLVEVQSSLAGVVEIHEMTLERDVMRMRAVPVLALPAGQVIELKPGGYHVMLMDLQSPLKAGTTVPLTLVLEKSNGEREKQVVHAPVRPLSGAASGHMGHDPRH